MDEVIHYLQLKNQYYEKFYTVTSRFWQAIECGDWSKTAEFTEQRDKILHQIRTYDFKISRALGDFNINNKRFEKFRTQINELLEKRKFWVDKIVEIDLKVITVIDKIKTERIKQLEDTLENIQEALPPSLGRERKLNPV